MQMKLKVCNFSFKKSFFTSRNTIISINMIPLFSKLNITILRSSKSNLSIELFLTCSELSQLFTLLGGKVPPDRTVVVNELRTVSLSLFACMTALCIAGILAAIALIIFNILHRHRR